MCGSVSGWAILPIAILDEKENFGFRYKVYSFIWNITWPVYNKFGTEYLWDFDMSGDGWDDYDSEGIPYWEKYNLDWDYTDEETGDAFRLIKNGIK